MNFEWMQFSPEDTHTDGLHKIYFNGISRREKGQFPFVPLLRMRLLEIREVMGARDSSGRALHCAIYLLSVSLGAICLSSPSLWLFQPPLCCQIPKGSDLS